MGKLPTIESMGPRPEPQPGTAAPGYQVAQGGELQGLEAANIGKQVAHFAAVEQEKVDTTQAEDAWNKYQNAATDLVAGENGLLRMQGADAVNGSLIKKAGTALDVMRKGIMDTLSPDVARRFAARADATDLQVKHQVLNHVVQQNQQYADIVDKGMLASAETAIRLQPSGQVGDSTFLNQWLRVEGATLGYMDRKGIKDPAAREAMLNERRDQMLATRYMTLVTHNPLEAKNLFDTSENTPNHINNTTLRGQIYASIEAASFGVATSADTESAREDLRKISVPSAQPRQSDQPSGQAATGVPVSVRQNNPGNLVDPATGQIRTYPTPEAGALALELDLKNKLAGTSPAYQRRFGNQPVTPERLAETWSPANAKGNSQESTTNYGKAVAAALGINPGDPIPNTPDAVAKVKTAITRFEAGPGSGAPSGMVKVAGNGVVPGVSATSTLPDANLIRANGIKMLDKIPAMADARYGNDKGNPKRVAYEASLRSSIQAMINQEVATAETIEKLSMDEMFKWAMGGGDPSGGGVIPTGGKAGQPGMVKTSIGQMQAEQPGYYAKFLQLSGQSQRAFLNLLEVNGNTSNKGDPSAAVRLYDRIHLPDDDPNKLRYFHYAMQDPDFKQLSFDQRRQVQDEFKRVEGMSGGLEAQIKSARARAINLMSKDFMLMANPYALSDAAAAYDTEVGKKYDAAMKNNIDPNMLFQPNENGKNPYSIIDGAFLKQINMTALGGGTQATGLAAQAKNVAAGNQPAIDNSKLPKADAAVNTPEKVNEFLRTNSASQYVIDPTGARRQNPFYTATAAAAQPAAGMQTPAVVPGAPNVADLQTPFTPDASKPDNVRHDGSIKGQGWLGPLKAPDGRVVTEYTVGVKINGKQMDIPTLVPTLTRAEVDQTLKAAADGKMPPNAVIEKAAAFAKKQVDEGKSVFVDGAPEAKAAESGMPEYAPPSKKDLKAAHAAQLKSAPGLQGFAGDVADAISGVGGMLAWAPNKVMTWIGEKARAAGISRADEETKIVSQFRELLKPGKKFNETNADIIAGAAALGEPFLTPFEADTANKMLNVLKEKSGSGGGGGMTQAEAEAAAKSGVFDKVDKASRAARGADQSAAPAGYKPGTDDVRNTGKSTKEQDDNFIAMYMRHGLSRTAAQAELARIKRKGK